MQENVPGEVIVPHQQDAGTAPMPSASSTDVAQQQAPAPNASFATEIPQDYPLPLEDVITWEADEYIAHEKSRQWYIAVLAGSIVIAALVYVLNRDIITALLVLVALAGLAAFGARRPRRQQYAVAPEGIQVGKMFYSFADFRSFAVAEEKTGYSLVFVSLKRFVPAINVYVPEAYEQAVIDLVSSILPMEPHTPDVVERFMSRIRF